MATNTALSHLRMIKVKNTCEKVRKHTHNLEFELNVGFCPVVF